MSISILATADEFDFDGEFAALVANYARTQPIGEPLPPADETLRRRERRPSRGSADRRAIEHSMREV
ncbi:hypothetical protein [Paractinoplanes toevensis]|uniref:Uncharacterized protein n=1 Tax=Paractinoplanes toevensis TaxID=571911 RepID=A0A919T3S6_9ACTN|nr:hypothetical protein [Actinoplanes toevensis]GIM88824.1 hypothetical protein Ato02nite_006170 [Actinoplanes toevensis]